MPRKDTAEANVLRITDPTLERVEIYLDRKTLAALEERGERVKKSRALLGGEIIAAALRI